MMFMSASSTADWGSPSFTSPESFALMWEYMRYFISAYMPYIMIIVAIFIAIAVASLVVYIFNRNQNDDDDDDEIEYIS